MTYDQALVLVKSAMKTGLGVEVLCDDTTMDFCVGIDQFGKREHYVDFAAAVVSLPRLTTRAL